MSVRNLHAMFEPTSVCVVGASNRERSVGSVVMRNLLQGGYRGPIMPINPKYDAIHGVLAYHSVAELPRVPDLAVICTPPATVPALIDELGRRGTRAAVVITAGLSSNPGTDGGTLQDELVAIAAKHQLRVLGPNCLGLIVPGIGLNASFSHTDCLPGRIAFVSQSGGLTTAVLDYANSQGIGFSHFLSLGDIADVDFGDVLDQLGSDPAVGSILLYVESIDNVREFMSAARAAARNKPVLVVKSGRFEEGAKAAASHTGALAGADDVYHAAFRRAGMLRVYEIDELFDAVQTLGRSKPLRGDRLAVLTNGGGPGVMAVDALIEAGGKLAELSAATIEQLDQVMPPTWSKANPVDIIGDAPGKRYAEALGILLADKAVDGVLVMHVPVAVADANEAAQAVIETCRKTNRNVLTSWLGPIAAARAREMFREAGLPTYSTPDRAVRGFMHVVRFYRNQELLMETPERQPENVRTATSTARLVIQNAMAAGRKILSEAESKAVLAAYGVPIVETQIAATADDAVRIGAEIGFPVAIKIMSPDITHKSDIGGVVLDLETRDSVRTACEQMLARVAKLQPEAQVTGFTVQSMARRPGAHELIVGVANDATFGPVMLFGEGGKAVEVIGDRAVALPPLNMVLARELISRTRISKLLQGYRDEAPADLDAICQTLIQVSQLVTDLAEVVELDINPLFADSKGVLALDARIRVEPSALSGPQRLAIRPYPKELEERVTIEGGLELLVRPIRPEDEPAHQDFVAKLTPEDIRFRFFGLVRDFPHSQMARLTQIDYDREMAFIARKTGDGPTETVGVVRAVLDADNETAEFAIVVRSDMKGLGLGNALLEKMIRYLTSRGTPLIIGQVLKDNQAMLGLARSFGFEITNVADDPEVKEVKLRLG